MRVINFSKPALAGDREGVVFALSPAKSGLPTWECLFTPRLKPGATILSRLRRLTLVISGKRFSDNRTDN